MSNTYANTAAVIGRGLRAAVMPGCLSTDAFSGTPAPTSPTTAVPAAHVFAAAAQATNAMKRQGTHPPRDAAALN